jgi:hypothetical protein
VSKISAIFAAVITQNSKKMATATISHEPLNATQIHFLQSLHFVKSDEMMQELQQLVSNYYFKKMEEDADKWWQENDMTQEKFDAMTMTSSWTVP